ncbi:isopeptide-forming domain-containing fimbrial protein [Paenibacillus sp. 32O-W]|uniref:isopeptide-forming domain-containing fimbrial protein n=1 Tax=Paenibacillus sp. 32O-W TaxID=1695218 RepID=UPI00119EC573|nr:MULTISPECIES: isopeptide-forming domain-containing fimbrial protein [Paenibacillaceae]
MTLVQFDGNNPTTTAKASVPITGITVNNLNGLALSLTENAFYASALGSANFYRIAADGKAEYVTTLDGIAGNAVIYDGKYYYSYGIGDKAFLGSYDLSTGNKTSTEIKGLDSSAADLGGDIVADGDGYLWFYRANSVMQLDRETANVLRRVPITNSDGVAIEWGVRGISFLPSGKMLLAGGNPNPKFYIIDPETNSTTYLGAMTGGLIFDLASRVLPEFEPNRPVLESKKTAEILEKAEGNTDVEHPEVGDTLLYTIQTRNTVENSLVKNLVISDEIPEGLEYVSGTLTVDGTVVSDDQDDDQGENVGAKATGRFGDVADTEWHTLTFQVKVTSGQAGQTIENIAAITGDNLDTPDEPNHTIDVYPPDPIEPPNACAAPVALINGSFEEPDLSNLPDDAINQSGKSSWMYIYDDFVPGWKTTDSTGVIEFGSPTKLGIDPDINSKYHHITDVPDGEQYVELNASESSQLYQDVKTTPGQTISWRLSHRAAYHRHVQGYDTMTVRIGSNTTAPGDLPVVETISTHTSEGWVEYRGTYTVPAGQTVTRFGFEAVDSVHGEPQTGNFLDDIFLGTEPCVVAEKTASPEGEVFAGQELTYEVTIKNNGGDIAANAVFEDAIPEGTVYVPGSLKITNGPGQGDLTDEDDSDAGHFDGQKVIVKLGDLPNASNLPDGITVQFKVKALVSDSINQIVNKAQVSYDNLLTNEEEQVDSNETKTPLTYQKPVLESTKTATIQDKAVGNTDLEHPEVGDTLLYSISTKNTVTDSLVKNLVISDAIPEGLEYVAGSLKVDGQTVTDAEDDDNGHYKEGTVIGQFGDITDTDEHTLTFLVKVGAGQAGADIKNIATVGGDNTEVPDKPEEEVLVYPRDPKFASEKTAANLDQAKEKFEVGDTVVYTIRARNAVSESIINNFTITDSLIEGLEYVEGSLKTNPEVNATFEDGTFTANFGEVKDTEWRTLTFHAKIQSGQLGKELKNIATVEGEDVPPAKPEVPIKVDPKDPKLESKKIASIHEKADGNKNAAHPEVGDTIRYTITTRNTIADSLVENLFITDMIPKGLTYVPGSLEVDGVKVSDAEGDDAGHVVGGKVTGTFGHVTDTAEHTVTFLVTVDKGQAGADIKNIATVGGENVPEPDSPEEEVLVYPRDPKFESEKTAANLDQAKEKYEVGDTVVYTIRARNAVSESIINNFTISDKLMEGLEYVEGSLKADPEVDAKFENGTVTANFGEVKDTEWRTLTFHAKILSGQSGKELKNIAMVEGKDVPPSHPEVPITVDPKDPKLESKKIASIHEKADGNTDTNNPEVGDTIRYTITTRNTIADSLVENLVITDIIPEGLTYVPGSLEVDGSKVTDAEDNDAGHVVGGTVTGTFGNVTDTAEHTVTFLVTVDQGQAGADIQNIAVVGGDNTEEPDEPSTTIEVFPRDSTLESVKTAVNQEAGKSVFEVGDTVIYTIKARNTVSDSLIRNFVISDVLPEGLAYVPGSLKVDGESVTDSVYANRATVTGSVYGEDGAVYDDNGYFADGRVVGLYGDITDTNWHTLEFKAIIQDGQDGRKIVNVAEVTGDDMDKPGRPTVEIGVENKPPTDPGDGTDPDDGTDPGNGTDPDDNHPPIVPDYKVTTPKDTPVSGKIEGEDPDGDDLTYEKGKDPKHGKVEVDKDGNWTYTPDPGFVGEDSFTVIVDDGKGGRTEVTIIVEVKEPNTPPTDPGTDPGNGTDPDDNRPPTSPDVKVTTPKDTPVSGKIEGEDPDGDELTYEKGKDPKHGKVEVDKDGNWTYTPDPGFVGEDSFTVIIDDGKGGRTEVTIIVEVKEPTTPAEPDEDTTPPSSGGGTPPTDSNDEEDETSPSEPGEGSTSEDVEIPSEPEEVTPPAEPEEETALPAEPEEAVTPEVPADNASPAQSPASEHNQLPNTSTNLYNLGVFGALILLAGLLLVRRRGGKMQ